MLLVIKVLQVHRVSKVYLVQHRLRVTLVQQVPKVRLEFKEQLEPRVLPVRKVPLGLKAQQVLRVPLVLKVRPELKVLLDLKALLV